MAKLAIIAFLCFIVYNLGVGCWYLLTEKGIDIYGPMILMKDWGDRWLMPGAKPTMRFIDRLSGEERTATVVCSCCGKPPEPLQTGYRGREAGSFSI